MPGVQSLVVVVGTELNRALQEVKKGISRAGSWDHRTILVGRVTCGLFRLSPAQSQASFEVRPGCSGLDSAVSWKPPGIERAQPLLVWVNWWQERQTCQMWLHFRKILMGHKAEGFPVVTISCLLPSLLVPSFATRPVVQCGMALVWLSQCTAVAGRYSQ